MERSSATPRSRRRTFCANVCARGPAWGLHPVLCGSSYKNKGVQQVLDAVADYLPAPTDVAAITPWTQTANPSVSASARMTNLLALAFKVINDAYGALTFVRIYSGVLTKGASVQNTTRGKRERSAVWSRCSPRSQSHRGGARR